MIALIVFIISNSIHSLKAICDLFKLFGKGSRVRLACGCPACALRCAPAPLTAHIAEGIVEESAEIKYDSCADDIVHLGFNRGIGISELEGGLEDCGRGQSVSVTEHLMVSCVIDVHGSRLDQGTY